MRQRGVERSHWVSFALLAAITACGAFLRLYRIDRLPPADGYDAAYYGVDALQLLEGRAPQLMYPPNREPLFSYLVTGSFLLFGASTTSIHLTSALIGVLTIPAVYFAAEALFRSEKGPLRRWGAPLAALMTAVSYWHINWSRIGVRAVLVPPFVAVTVAFLWRALRNGGLARFGLCGLFLGLSMYTYQAARLLPTLVVVGFAALAWERGRITKEHWRGLAVTATVALLVFAPLGIHFITHPGSFSRRIEEALVVQSDRATLGNVKAVAGQIWEAVIAFSFAGDATPYSTIPGRPSLNPFFSMLLFLGLVGSVLQIKKPSRLLLLAWLVLMTIPATLAGKGPTAKRAIGSLPAVAALVAIGAATPWTWLLRAGPGSRLQERASWIRIGWTVILLVGFIYSGAATYRDYFVVWASNPDLPKHFEAHISSIGEYIADLPPDQLVYLSPELPKHPSIRFHSDLREDIRGYNGRVCFVAPRMTRADTTYVIVPGTGDTSLDLLESAFPQGTRIDSKGTAFTPYFVPAGVEAKVQPPCPLEATWNDAIQLLGYDLGAFTYRAGETIPLTLTYLDLRQMTKHYTVFVHLLGRVNPATGTPLWGQNDSEPCRGFYPTTSWHEGEVLIDHLELKIPDDAPAGTYRLGMGFYDVWTGVRLPVESDAAGVRNGTLILGEIDVERG